MSDAPLIFWFRRDLRLGDHPGLAAAVATGRPIVPAFVLDPETEAQGAAPKWRLGLSVEAFGNALAAAGAPLILRRGDAVQALRALVRETGATAVHWTRLYDPDAAARDARVAEALAGDGTEAVIHGGHLLHEPWSIQTKSGSFYKVFTPFLNALREVAPDGPAAEVTRLRGASRDIASDTLADWALGAAMDRGAAVVARRVTVGEAAARARLRSFLDDRVEDYAAMRDRPDRDGTSGMSENLTYGEIGVREVFEAAQAALRDGKGGAQTFLKELVWREFAYHLLHHTPRLRTGNWRQDWDRFPWRPDGPDAERWRRGMTGEPIVDAAMRELFVTGRMHNRARLIVASYLTKHLLTHWRVGCAWFEDCLIDWDVANNSLNWQWVAGSGPDASPFFRIFNPATQAAKFDPKARYRERFLAELCDEPGRDALDFFEAAPRAWALDPGAPYPEAMIDLGEGRARALGALKASGL